MCGRAQKGNIMFKKGMIRFRKKIRPELLISIIIRHPNGEKWRATISALTVPFLVLKRLRIRSFPLPKSFDPA